MDHKVFKAGIRISAILVLTFFLLHIGVYLFQDFIIFQPQRLGEGYAFQFEAPHQEVWLESEDGVRINGVFFKGEEPSEKVVLYLHGNSDNLQRWGRYHSDFTTRGMDFFAIDYRGYGKSKGIPSEEGLYKDAEAAYEYLLKKYTPSQIYIFGRSLGTGVAGFLASEKKAAMLMLETPYHSMKDVFQRQAPFLYLPFPLSATFPLHEYLSEVEEPVYIFHGTADEIVPYSSAAAMKPNLASEENFLTIPGGRHRGLSEYEAYQEYLDGLLGEKN